jgi:YVTN family beta-propeller protein
MQRLWIFVVGFSFIWASASGANKVIATIEVGDTPAGIAVTPDSLFAYVANNNNDGLPNGDSVSVLNLLYNTVEQTIHDSSFNEPYTVTINKTGTRAYITNSGGSTVTIVDIATNTVVGTIDGFDGPSGFAITPDQKFAYVNNYGAAGGLGSGNGTTVRVVDLSTNTIVGPPLTVGLAPSALEITPDGAYVYVISYTNGNLGAGTISIIKTSDNSVALNAITGLSGPFIIAITPNGHYAYITNFGSNNFSPVGTTVSVVSLTTNSIVDTIPVGVQPSGIAITPDGAFAYVTNYSTLYNGPGFTDLTPAQGTVDIIDLQNNKPLGTIIGGVGSSPANIAIAPNGQFAYVTNYQSHSVSVIALPSTLYNINRLTPPYERQKDKTITKLNQANL